MAGTNRLNDVAANITPAENPSITSNNLSDTFEVNNTGKAPAPVANPAIKLATEPSKIVSSINLFYSLYNDYRLLKKGRRKKRSILET